MPEVDARWLWPQRLQHHSPILDSCICKLVYDRHEHFTLLRCFLFYYKKLQAWRTKATKLYHLTIISGSLISTPIICLLLGVLAQSQLAKLNDDAF